MSCDKKKLIELVDFDNETIMFGKKGLSIWFRSKNLSDSVFCKDRYNELDSDGDMKDFIKYIVKQQQIIGGLILFVILIKHKIYSMCRKNLLKIALNTFRLVLFDKSKIEV